VLRIPRVLGRRLLPRERVISRLPVLLRLAGSKVVAHLCDLLPALAALLDHSIEYL
jgi:hypothetical protein